MRRSGLEEFLDGYHAGGANVFINTYSGERQHDPLKGACGYERAGVIVGKAAARLSVLGWETGLGR